jgi:hypothetical protein
MLSVEWAKIMGETSDANRIQTIVASFSRLAWQISIPYEIWFILEVISMRSARFACLKATHQFWTSMTALPSLLDSSSVFHAFLTCGISRSDMLHFLERKPLPYMLNHKTLMQAFE